MGGQVSGLDPIVDGVRGDAEPVGGLGDADLSRGERPGGGDVVDVADPGSGQRARGTFPFMLQRLASGRHRVMRKR